MTASKLKASVEKEYEGRFGLQIQIAPNSALANRMGGGVLKYTLGGYVPPGSPKQDPVLERFCIQNDTPF